MKIEKPWGWEFIKVNDELKCLKFMYCSDNIWSSSGLYHMHLDKDEDFVVIDGKLELDIDGVVHVLEEGVTGKCSTVRIKPLTPHRFRSDGCFFLEVSTHDSPEDSVRGTLEDLRNWSRVDRPTTH